MKYCIKDHSVVLALADIGFRNTLTNLPTIDKKHLDRCFQYFNEQLLNAYGDKELFGGVPIICNCGCEQ